MELLTWFRNIARTYSTKIAIEEEGRASISYGDLLSEAEALAGWLVTQGIGRESLVGLCFEKSTDYIVSLLGVWMSGAAFMPLDATYPQQRLFSMVKEAQPKLILSSAEHLSMTMGLGAPSMTPNFGDPRLIEGIVTQADDLAYVFYTSGSSGEPKGVEITHRGIPNLLAAQIEAFQIGPQSRSLLYLSINFDASVSDIGTALFSGATLVLAPTRRTATAATLMNALSELQITHLDFPPALLPTLDVDEIPSCLKTIIIGGEVCPPQTIQKWAPRVRLMNVYGPTEATVCVSLGQCTETWDRPLLGKPIPNIGFSVLDEDLRQVGPGEVGELFISGIGLARGYRARPALTAARFGEIHGKRHYRTGDKVRLCSDGELEFLGRMDRQVKLRGQLVDLRDVESQLLKHPNVLNTVVMKRGDGAKASLQALVVPKAKHSIEVSELRRYLARRVPAFMLPSQITVVAELPLSSSGKVDVGALEQTSTSLLLARTAPRTDLEAQLALLWRDIFKVDEVGVDESFFDLGGDSLKALELVVAAQAIGLVLNPALVMGHSTIAEMAEQLDRSKSSGLDRRSAAELSIDAEMGTLSAPVKQASHKAKPHFPPRRLLLTGASGFLGGQLLRELLEHWASSEVVCLVRASSPDQAANRMKPLLSTVSPELATRVTFCCGDVSRPQFGLADAAWKALATSIDGVFHCAAEVNMVSPYEDLFLPNVEGVRQVLRLVCEGAPKQLHYASTLSVFVSTDQNSGVAQENDLLENTRWVYGGYAQTKWVAERLVTQAVQLGLPDVYIYRLGLITGHTHTGQVGSKDFLGMFFRGIRSLGRIPNVDLDALAIDVTPVDFAAAAMRALAQHATPGVFHLANPQHATLQQLVDALRAEHIELHTVPQTAWSELATQLKSLDETLAYLALCRCLPEAQYEHYRTVDLFQSSGITFDASRASPVLRQAALSCPKVTHELLRQYVATAIQSQT